MRFSCSDRCRMTSRVPGRPWTGLTPARSRGYLGGVQGARGGIRCARDTYTPTHRGCVCVSPVRIKNHPGRWTSSSQPPPSPRLNGVQGGRLTLDVPGRPPTPPSRLGPAGSPRASCTGAHRLLERDPGVDPLARPPALAALLDARQFQHLLAELGAAPRVALVVLAELGVLL